jgi:hypothetical protein
VRKPKKATMTNLEQIDKVFSTQLSELRELIATYDFNVQFEFKLDESSDYSNSLNKLSFPGIYLIEIKTKNNQTFDDWLTNFKNQWEDHKYKHKFVPNIKAKRTKQHSVLSEWIPLYIGKSKDISKRIKEHLDLKLDRPTTALKLRERSNIYQQEFRVSTINIKVDNYDLIMPQFENLMRDRINPILGRQ